MANKSRQRHCYLRHQQHCQRVINYLLVPHQTLQLLRALRGEYGGINIYAYTALLLVLLTTTA